VRADADEDRSERELQQKRRQSGLAASGAAKDDCCGARNLEPSAGRCRGGGGRGFVERGAMASLLVAVQVQCAVAPNGGARMQWLRASDLGRGSARNLPCSEELLGFFSWSDYRWSR
jgi:hypothetical protein